MSLATEVLADSPHAYWKLDETSGTTAVDSSGNGKDASYSGGFTLASESTARGNAVQFDGTNGHVFFTATSDTWLYPAWTLECWVKIPTIPTSDKVHAIMTQGYPGSGTLNMSMGIDLDASGNSHSQKFMGGLFNGGWKAATYSGSLTANSWLHLVCTWASAVPTLYLNGSVAVVGSNTASGTAAMASNPDFRLARRWDTSDTEQYLACSMQHAAVYPSALSGTRVAAHYTAGTTTPPAVNPSIFPAPRAALVRASTR